MDVYELALATLTDALWKAGHQATAMPCPITVAPARIKLYVEGEIDAIRVDFGTAQDRRVPMLTVQKLADCLVEWSGKRGCLSWDQLHDVFDEVLLFTTGRHRGLFADGAIRRRDVEIARNKLAVKRLWSAMIALSDEPAPLGPPSVVSDHNRQKAERLDRMLGKLGRTLSWLQKLITKRGEPQDVALLAKIDAGTWPE